LLGPLFVNLAGARVVARYPDGRLIKGYTYDFQPGRDSFDIFPDRSPSTRPSAPVTLADLEAVFFVRDLEGNSRDAQRPDVVDLPGQSGECRVTVTFRDGEVLVGTIEDQDAPTTGFWLIPADPLSNILRVYAVQRATTMLARAEV